MPAGTRGPEVLGGWPGTKVTVMLRARGALDQWVGRVKIAHALVSDVF